MNEATFNAINDKLTAAYLAASGQAAVPAGFDITIIISIILALLQLFPSICPAKTPKEVMADPGVFGRFVINNQVRKHLREQYGFGAWAKYNGSAITEAIIKEGKAADDATIGALQSCCG
jgi:hypothetical protein